MAIPRREHWIGRLSQTWWRVYQPADAASSARRTRRNRQSIEIVREGLGRAAGIEDLDPLGSQPCHREAHGHAVIVIGRNPRRAERLRRDRQPILELDNLLPDPAQL